MYDQLHRIKEMQLWTGVDLVNYQWPSVATPQTDYQTTFSYDPNGNITSLVRYGDNVLMDQLSYNYTSGKNLLTSVSDAVASGAYTQDLDNQGANNYTYDGAGNLVADAQAGTAITWTAYGKVQDLERTSGGTRCGYDPVQNRLLKELAAGSVTTQTYYICDAASQIDIENLVPGKI